MKVKNVISWKSRTWEKYVRSIFLSWVPSTLFALHWSSFYWERFHHRIHFIAICWSMSWMDFYYNFLWERYIFIRFKKIRCWWWKKFNKQNLSRWKILEIINLKRVFRSWTSLEETHEALVARVWSDRKSEVKALSDAILSPMLKHVYERNAMNFTSGNRRSFHTWGIICYDLYSCPALRLNLFRTKTRELFIMKTYTKHEKKFHKYL